MDRRIQAQKWSAIGAIAGMQRHAAPLSTGRGVAVIVGVGPGLGLSLARRFAREGFTVAILARNLDKLMKLAEEIVEKESKAQVAAIRIDCADHKSINEAFEAVHSLGTVEVLVYNIGAPLTWPPPKFMETSVEMFQQGLVMPSMGAFHCLQQVIPGMLERKRGTTLFTGATAAIRGKNGFSSFACGKFAIRALSQCLAREYQPQGIHVVHVLIDGIINTKKDDDSGGSKMNPDAIAEAYWQLHMQDKSAWTHELDLRPFCEQF